MAIDERELGSALGKILAAERSRADDQLASALGPIQTQLNGIDGTELIKGILGNMLRSNLQALSATADGILLKNSTHTSGKLPDVVKAAL